MALTVRRIDPAIIAALVSGFNSLKREVTETTTTYPHYDITSTTSGDHANPSSTPVLPSSASATTLPTTITRTENIRVALRAHFNDGVAHKAADATAYAAVSTTTVPTATDQGTVNTALNAFKAAWNTHLASLTQHVVADATYTVATADATDLASSEALANALYTAVRGHIQFALTTPSITLVGP